MTTDSRWFGWWTFSRGLVARLTNPRTDVADVDRRFETLLLGSTLVAFALSATPKIHAAWRGSRTRTVVNAAARALRPADHADRIRTVGAIVTVASLTALLCQALKPIPAEPFTWLMPVAAAVVGVVVMAAAVPLARTMQSRVS